MSNGLNESANVTAIKNLLNVSETLIEVVANTNTKQMQPFIENSVLAHVENTPFTELDNEENIRKYTSRISTLVRGQAEEEKPKGYNLFTKNTYSKNIEEFTKIAVQAKADYYKKEQSKIFLEELGRNNDTLIKDFIDGQLTFKDTFDGITENITIASEKQILKDKEKYGQQQIAKLLSVANFNTADNLAKEQYLEVARDYLSPKDYQKFVNSLDKELRKENTTGARNSFFAQAINKVVQGRYGDLTDKERLLPTVRTVQDKMEKIKLLSISSLQNLRAERRQNIINQYMTILENQGKKKPEQLREIERTISSMSISELNDYLMANAKSKDPVTQALISNLNDASLDDEIIEKRTEYLESQFALNSATTAVELGWRPDVLIDFDDSQSIEDGISQLNLNFQDDLVSNIASTYMSDYLLDDFSVAYESKGEKAKFAMIKRFSDRMPEQAKRSFINQLATVDKSASTNFELYTLTRQNYTKEIENIYKEGKELSKDPMDTTERMIINGYGNSAIGANMAELYKNLPTNSPLKEKIKKSVNISDGMYFAEPIDIQINGIGNQNLYSRSVTLAQGLQRMPINYLKQMSGTKTIYRKRDFRTKESLSQNDMNFIQLQNLGGGSFVLFSGTNQSIDNILVDNDGNVLIFNIDTLRQSITRNEQTLDNQGFNRALLRSE